jgi:hypothetical protein
MVELARCLDVEPSSREGGPVKTSRKREKRSTNAPVSTNARASASVSHTATCRPLPFLVGHDAEIRHAFLRFHPAPNSL